MIPAKFFSQKHTAAKRLDSNENWAHLRTVLWYSLRTIAFEEKTVHKTPMKFQEFVKYMGAHESMMHYKGEHAKKVVRAFLGWVTSDCGGFLSEGWGEFGVEDGWVTLLPETHLKRPNKPFINSFKYDVPMHTDGSVTASYTWDTSSTTTSTSTDNIKNYWASYWGQRNDTSTVTTTATVDHNYTINYHGNAYYITANK